MGNLIYRGHLHTIYCEARCRHLLRLDNGTFWRQIDCQNWSQWAYRPKVDLTKDLGCYVLHVCGEQIAVEPITEVIESEIRVAVKCGNGEQRYVLSNGQTWVECGGKFRYDYAFYPKALICNIRGMYYMYSHNMQCQVRRES